jgi:hypothetical protein
LKWEYKIEQAVGGFPGTLRFNVGNLNQLGEEEWEAVGIFYDVKYSQTYVLLKRPKK